MAQSFDQFKLFWKTEPIRYQLSLATEAVERVCADSSAQLLQISRRAHACQLPLREFDSRRQIGQIPGHAAGLELFERAEVTLPERRVPLLFAAEAVEVPVAV